MTASNAAFFSEQKDKARAEQLLDLLQLSDSALPIGAQSHSFGLETLAAEGQVTSGNLEAFLRAYLQESLLQDALFCRSAYVLGREPWPEGDATGPSAAVWLQLNRRLAALRPAQETREAGAVLGRRYLALAAEISGSPVLAQARAVANWAGVQCQHATAFGLVGGALDLGQEAVVLAYLHQSVGALLAAAQKLLPVGQNAVTRMRWQLKPALLEAAVHSAELHQNRLSASSFAPLVELASMRHPGSPVRLFIS